MGTLNRWRQISSRCYFWPYLLLRMVASRFGVPLFPGSVQDMMHQIDIPASISRQSAFQVGFSQLEWLKNLSWCHAYAIDYLYQYVIRTVIRHLPINWVYVPVPEASALRRMSQRVLFTTIGLLLNHEIHQSILVHCRRQIGYVAFIDNRTVIPSDIAIGNTRWLAPSFLSLKKRNFPQMIFDRQCMRP